ncbi:hypothetical protein [Helicobacter trogontum]|uniref:Uncharacterized protein n=1 Tax=Helicobacter trogontum TaxID=50960 RepID=A0A4U8TEY2_9HELI|nr:hypothetical protein [Helicobacter trogontum]MCI5786693.1 hypothetical protein [Helicobacter trogontum]MDY5186106.1 hypothetical protein [Helicobacter trogontum]TLD98621.1 hypothetical protein LS80_004035 [Helicobacter trogontum]
MQDNSHEKTLLERVEALQNELQAQKKTTKNVLKLSFGVGILCFFFVALNLSILFTIAGGVAGNERKVQSLQTQVEKLQNFEK